MTKEQAETELNALLTHGAALTKEQIVRSRELMDLISVHDDVEYRARSRDLFDKHFAGAPPVSRPKQFGGLRLRTLGPAAGESGEELALDTTDEYSLCAALARRGFDVEIKTPTPEQLERRRKQRLKETP